MTNQRRSLTGVSLIMVMVMMLVISLGAATVMRMAISEEQMTNNMRVQSLAHQYAEAALSYCESELVKPNTQAPSSGRKGTTLENANILEVPLGGNPGWSQAVTWTGTGGASASRTVVPATRVQSVDSSFVPTKLPECVVELQTLDAGGSKAYVITARGFSPDYQADASTGSTLRGAVVWLQSNVLAE